MNIKREIKKAIVKGIIVAFSILSVGMLWVVWEGFLKNVIPFTKTKFRNYAVFYEKADNNFPNEIPSTATEVKYYYFTGYMDKICGVSFLIGDDEEYQKLKQTYLLQYDEAESIESTLCVFDIDLTSEFIQEEKIDFIEELLKQSVEEYSILVYEKVQSEHSAYKKGVIINDETREFIMIEFMDKFFNESR